MNKIMLTDKHSCTFILLAGISVSTILLVSCGQKITKGDVYQSISKKISIGANKADVIKVTASLEVNGYRVERSNYLPAESVYIDAPDGKKIKVAGTMSANFRDAGSGPMTFNSIGIIFYFDESERLVNYHIDYF